MKPKPRVDVGRMDLLSSSKSMSPRQQVVPFAKAYSLALITTLLSAASFGCLLASGLSCSFLSITSDSNSNVQIDPNTTNIPEEDLWYYNEMISNSNNNALSVGILCQGDLDWLAPNTSDNSMRLLSKIFLIVSLALSGLVLVITCAISTFLPTSNIIWDGISYIAAGLFVCEMPIFFLFDSPPCSNAKNVFVCQLGSGSYTLIVSMICSLSLALLTQWKNPPDWKEEYEIWNLRRRNGRMNKQRGMFGDGSNTPPVPTEESSSDDNKFNDEEMALQDDHQHGEEEMGVEIQVEKIPSPQRRRPNNTTKSSSPSYSQRSTSIATEVYGTDHGRNAIIVKEPSSPPDRECNFAPNEMRPVSPLSTCTGLSFSPQEGRRSSPTTDDEYGNTPNSDMATFMVENNLTPNADRTSFMENGLTPNTDRAVFMEHDLTPNTDMATFMEEEIGGSADYAGAYLTKPKPTTSDDNMSIQSSSKQSVTSKQSIVSLVKDKLSLSWRSSSNNDVQIQGSALGDSDREEFQENWMVEDVSVGNSTELSLVDKAKPSKGQAHTISPQEASDIDKDIAGLLVPGMIDHMKQQIAKKPLVSPERANDPDIDMYPSESSVSELSSPNHEEEEYLKRIEEEYLKQNNSAPVRSNPVNYLPVNYQSDSSGGGNSELDQVIAGVQRINRKTSGKITPLNRRNRRRRGSRSVGGGGSVSGDSYSSAQGSLLDEIIMEGNEDQNNISTEISIPNVITPEKKKKSRGKTRRRKSESRVTYADDVADDHSGYHQSGGDEEDEQSVTSSVASARRHRLALNRKGQLDPPEATQTGTSKLDEFLESEAGGTEDKVKLLQEALDRLQKLSTGDEGYMSSSAAKNKRPQQPLLTRVNQRYTPKAETVDLPLNVRNTPYAQDVNTGAAPTSSDRTHSDSAWQARKNRLKRLRMLRAETEESSDDSDATPPRNAVIRAKGGLPVACASDEGSI